MIKALSRRYVFRDGAPAVREVDTELFVHRYFMRCMECSFCHDACCARGCDVDVETIARLRARAPELEAYTGTKQDEWFEPVLHDDPDSPGGAYAGTTLPGGSCIFLDVAGRGCKIHRFCLERGIDYHALKPPLCSLFPAIAVDERLKPNLSEALYQGLVCRGEGPTFYEGARDELLYYGGPELVRELDALAHELGNDPDHREIPRAFVLAPPR